MLKKIHTKNELRSILKEWLDSKKGSIKDIAEANDMSTPPLYSFIRKSGNLTDINAHKIANYLNLELEFLENNYIKKKRIEQGISVVQFAKMLGVNPQNVSEFEKQESMVSTRNKKIAQFLNISLEELAYGKSFRNNFTAIVSRVLEQIYEQNIDLHNNVDRKKVSDRIYYKLFTEFFNREEENEKHNKSGRNTHTTD